MELTTYFSDFINNISLTEDQRKKLRKAHTELQDFLDKEESIKDIYVTSFLQGSYRRSTALKPINGESSDVDVVLVTTVDYNITNPSDFLNAFYNLLDSHYPDLCRIQGRSIGINLKEVSMDLVPVAVINPHKNLPGAFRKMYRSSDTLEDLISNNMLFEANNAYNPENPLMISDRKTEKWKKTHPLAQLKWTHDKNKSCNGHYLHVVKAIKWWHKLNYPNQEQPNSYPLEHFIGDCCPNGINSVAEGIVKTFENMMMYFNKPYLPDRGVPEQDVFEKVTEREYREFYNAVSKAAPIARKAYDSTDRTESVNLWRNLLGNEFPEPPKDSVYFTKREEPTNSIPRGNFA